ncbi:unnamed protein product [Closterium sp. NIES-54]
MFCLTALHHLSLCLPGMAWHGMQRKELEEMTKRLKASRRVSAPETAVPAVPAVPTVPATSLLNSTLPGGREAGVRDEDHGAAEAAEHGRPGGQRPAGAPTAALSHHLLHCTHGTALHHITPTSPQEDERRVYGMKIMELQKQLSMDDREANDLQVRPSPLPLFPLPTRSLTYDF